MDFISFALERYNYWIFIALMMTGLYIVISRGNLVKKLIGLNVFQTSVFIFYISIGKIRGGTAPIYLPDDLKAREHAAHGLSKLPGKEALGEGARPVQSLHDNALAGNSLESLTTRIDSEDGAALHHDAPANAPIAAPHAEAGDIAAAASPAYDSAHALDIVYSNPLPHVLILTAIVVGVATTAVGLALAVRIREAYGTIEEDELEAADNVAEFGRARPSMEEEG
jgi:multicomponent Na+:H+ antiporter subunit C